MHDIWNAAYNVIISGSLYIYSQRQYFFFDVSCQEEGEPQGTVINTEPGQVSVNNNTLSQNLQDNPQDADSIELELVSFDDNYKVDSCQKVYVKNSMPSLSLVLAKVSQNYVPTKEELTKTNVPYPTSLQHVLDDVMQGRFGTNQNVVTQQN